MFYYIIKTKQELIFCSDNAKAHLKALLQLGSKILLVSMKLERHIIHELPLKKTNNGQKGFSFKGAKSWNGLSAGAKCAPSLASFKSYL